MEIDASDRVWSLFGSSVHAVLDKLPGDTEERLFAWAHNRKISGKYDRIENGRLNDYKVTSVWTVVYESRYEDWIDQLSIYRWLYWVNKGIKLDDTGVIIAILRDWTKRDLEKTKTGKYPKFPIVEIPLKLYPITMTQLLVENKVEAIMAAEKLKDEELPECNKEERWWNEKKQEFMKCAKYCNGYKWCHQVKRTNEDKKD